MTVPEAAAAFGTSLVPASPLDEEELSCHYVFPNGTAGPIGFMIVDDHVARIDIGAPSSRTEMGVGVGSTESEVLAAYQGRAAVEPHPYTAPEGHYIVVAPLNERGAIFETDGTRVLSFRVGRADAVRWIEGCL